MDALIPRTSFTGRALEFDLPGVEVGVAEYHEGPTGCTVFHFPAGVSAAADVRGGSPGTFMAELTFVRAVCFAGGSLLGLEACAGVMAELFERRGRTGVRWEDVPLVSGAIVFDFGGRDNGIYPDRELGRAALRAARPGVFPLGQRGAARNARVGRGSGADLSEAGGQGAASRVAGPLRIVAFTVVNSLGAIHGRDGRVVRGHLDARTGERLSHAELLAGAPPGGAGTPSTHTTLTLVATNQRLSPMALRQSARQVHASMARAIQPFHTAFDGDVLWMTTTNQVDHPPYDAPEALGSLASEAVWDAVLSSFEAD